jgi:hypothetical protein
MNMRQTLEMRIEIIRSVREEKFKLLDYNINLLADAGEDVASLRSKRQRLRDITEPYKDALENYDITPQDENGPLFAYEWDVFTSVNWD